MDPLLAVSPESRVDGARCTLIHRMMMPHRLLLPPLGGAKSARRVLAGRRGRDSGRVLAADSSTAPFCRLRPSADPRTWTKDAVGKPWIHMCSVSPRFCIHFDGARRDSSNGQATPYCLPTRASMATDCYRQNTQPTPHTRTPSTPLLLSMFVFSQLSAPYPLSPRRDYE